MKTNDSTSNGFVRITKPSTKQEMVSKVLMSTLALNAISYSLANN
jgi:hypothetical protein